MKDESDRRDHLTDPKVRALRAGEVRTDIPDGRVPGLFISVLPSGRKQWALRYRTKGKQRRLVLGDFPGLSLAKARVEAERARPKIRDGADPVAERTAAKARPTGTVAALSAEYLKRHASQKRSADEDERILDVDVLPSWKDRSVRELTRRDVRALLEPILDRGSATMANRVLSLVRKMLNYGVDNDWLDANPAARIKKPGKEVSRDRVLTDDEVRALWDLLGRFPETHEKQAPGRPRADADAKGRAFCPISTALAAAFKVRLLTAQRGGEITKMRWQDIDLSKGWWTIPGSDTKNGEPHRVPLTIAALTVIEAQAEEKDRTGLVFVGFGESLADRTKKAGAALSKTLKFAFRGHDLRRTAATGMAAAGVARDHIARVLNHVDGGARATRVYDRHSYDAEKRRALEMWARELARILEARPRPATVVPISRGAR